MAKRILVCGDVIVDHNLVQMPVRPLGHHDPLPETVSHAQLGGAWYATEMVRIACNDRSDLEITGPRKPDKIQTQENPVWAHAHSLWSPHDRLGGDTKSGRVWRILDFLGCQGRRWNEFPAKESEQLDDEKADLIVINDENLGFRNETQQVLWPKAIRNASPESHILIKTSGPLESNHLWNVLAKKHMDRLTVVTSIDELRDRHAQITKALSWDRTLHELELEMRQGGSRDDLARAYRVFIRIGREGVALFEKGRLKRLIFHPAELEGTWERSRPGATFGATMILSASIVRHIVDPTAFPVFFAVARALQAMRNYHDEAGGIVEPSSAGTYVNNFDIEATSRRLSAVFQTGYDAETLKRQAENNLIAACLKNSAGLPKAVASEVKALAMRKADGKPGNQSKMPPLPEDIYRCVVPLSMLDAESPLQRVSKKRLAAAEKERREPIDPKCDFGIDIIEFVVGAGRECALAKAREIVYNGIEKALHSVPQAGYGRYFTVDRDEIERINELRRLIENYRYSKADTKPLSIAVFGPPGSGKSFAIRELAGSIFGKSEQTILTFNLSQFPQQPDALYSAFHSVRDASIQGHIPLVFWDEFDTGDLCWLKSFLAPMEDAMFLEHGVPRIFGKAIFVFAGGTKHRFAEFIDDSDKTKYEKFTNKKGPDFVSRLRAYVDVKGTNVPELAQGKDPSLTTDAAHVIRRAIILRSTIERMYPHLINGQSKIASISGKVMQGFLGVKEYVHGARSLTAIVGSSDLAGRSFFNADALPSRNLLNLHVSADFTDAMNEPDLDINEIESAAISMHKAWAKWHQERIEAKDIAANEKHLPYEYHELSETEKEDNRRPVRQTIGILKDEGYTLTHSTEPGNSGNSSGISSDEITRLAIVEHDIWLREMFLRGFEWAEEKKEEKKKNKDRKWRLHHCCTYFKNVPKADQKYDLDIINSLLASLKQFGYILN